METRNPPPAIGRPRSQDRRALIVGAAAAVAGIAVLPFLPRGKKLDPADLLKPEVAEGNPEVLRQLCLAFYSHPNPAYRSAAAAHLLAFEDPKTQNALFALIRKDPVNGIRLSALRSLLTQQDPGTFGTLAELYWHQPELRTTIDQFATLYELNALKTQITLSKP